MDETRLQQRIGLTALGCVVAAIFFMVVILPRWERGPRVRITVYFREAGNVRVGAPVRQAGRSIGRVAAIAMVAPGSEPLLGGERGVQVTLTLYAQAAQRIAPNAEVFVSSQGPLSERYIEIANRGAAAPIGLFADARLRGTDPPNLDRALTRTWENLAVARAFRDHVRMPWHDFTGAVSALRVTLDTYAHADPTWQQWQQRLAALQQELTLVDAMLAESAVTWPQLQALLTRTSALFVEARQQIAVVTEQWDALAARAGHGQQTLQHRSARFRVTTARLFADAEALWHRLGPTYVAMQALQRQLAAGEGTLQRLLNDPEFPEDARELGKIIKRTPWKVVGHPQDGK